jgi:hypothetical protein
MTTHPRKLGLFCILILISIQIKFTKCKTFVPVIFPWTRVSLVHHYNDDYHDVVGNMLKILWGKHLNAVREKSPKINTLNTDNIHLNHGEKWYLTIVFFKCWE